MTASAAVQWRKELRELLPWWGATVLTMASCWVLMRPDVIPPRWVLMYRPALLGTGMLAYLLGTVTLGAMSIGHEYSHRTLTPLLAQPVARGRVLQIKLAVLAIILGSLSLLAVGAWGTEPLLVGLRPRLLLGLLPIAGGLCLAPWLTMVGRGPLAGVVFTLALWSLAWVLGTGFRMPVTSFLLATLVLCPIGAVMTWRTFLRLEDTGGSQADVDLSAWFTESKADRQSLRTKGRTWQLVRKELRLQQATFVVSGIYVVVCVAVIVVRQFDPAMMTGALYFATVLNSGLVSLMAGSIAIAEERSLGAAEWHTLLPFALWRQWLIKASVALGLTFALAVVPALILEALNAETGVGDGMEPPTVIALCIVALYVSSVSSSGLRALLASLPAIGVTMALGITAMRLIGWVADPAILWLARVLNSMLQLKMGTHPWWMENAGDLLVIGFVLLLLGLSYANYRTAELSSRRTFKQVAWLAAYGVGSYLLSDLTFYSLMVSYMDFRK